MRAATLKYGETLAIALRATGHRLSSIGHTMSWFREDLPLRWKINSLPSGGSTAHAIIGGNKETGELHMLVCIEKGAAPLHRHGAGKIYGELTLTIAGELHDMNDDCGSPIVLGPGAHIVHRPGSVHRPYAPNFWFGYCHQPRGSELVHPTSFSAA